MDKDFEKLQKMGLENITSNLFNKTPNGRVINTFIHILGIVSIFFYYNILNINFVLNVIISLILGFLTHSILGALLDIFVGKFFRIDKQINWLLKTPEGQKYLEEKGATKEDVEKLKNELGLNILKNN